MARHHVRPDGSVGRCDAKEGGRRKFAREGALHFESASEAQEYAAELLAHRSGGFMQGGAGSGVANSASSGASSTALGADQESALNLSEEKWAARMGELRNDFSARKYVASSPAARGVDLAAVVKGDSGSPSASGVTLIAERETRMSSAELVAHMDRLKRDPSVWEHVVSSPDAMGGELAAVANGALEAGGRENLLLAVRAVRHENMIPDARRYVVTHPDLWDEALSDPGFYGWSSEDVRDVFEVLRGVAVDTARRGAVSDVFVDSCVELFFRVLRARGCVVNDDAVRLALSGAAGELVCAVLPGEQSLASLSVDAVAAGLARVGDIVCGAAISVSASDDVEREALRLAESARLIAAASGGLP